MSRLLLTICFTVFSTLAFAKVPLIEGLYQGEGKDGRGTETTFAYNFTMVNIPGTTPRITDCKTTQYMQKFCDHAQDKLIKVGNKKYAKTIFPMSYGYNIDFEGTNYDWTVLMGAIDQDGHFTSIGTFYIPKHYPDKVLWAIGNLRVELEKQ